MAIRQNALQRLGKTSISAKDIASQAWCEKQMELYIKTPMTETFEMRQGSQFHQIRKDEVFVPLRVEPETWPDRLYKTAYENYTSISSLEGSGKCRELRLYGSINGFRVSGQLDEIRLEGGKATVVEDKTVAGGVAVSEAKIRADSIQVSIYRMLLEDIRAGRYTFDNFDAGYATGKMQLSENFQKGLSEIGVRKELISVSGMYRAMFEKVAVMPQIGESMEIRYFGRNTSEIVSTLRIQYDPDRLDEWIRYAMGYWRGEREAQPVSEVEKWKCGKCRFFGNKCTAWYGG